MNLTRFFKDSTIMGDKFRKATYIIKKSEGNLKISAILPHTTLDEQKPYLGSAMDIVVLQLSSTGGALGKRGQK